MKLSGYLLDRISWKELENILKSNYKLVAVVPTGSTEQHGPHLPLGTDYMIADGVASKLIEHINKYKPLKDVIIIKLPAIPYGYSAMWSSYIGTITLSIETLRLLIKDIITSLITQGIHRIVILNAHSGNDDIIKVSIREVLENLKKGKVIHVNIWELAGDVINNIFNTKFFHADEVETSLGLALGIGLRCKPVPSPSPFRYYDDFWHSLDLTKRPKIYIFQPESTRQYGIGSFGRPDLASKEKGIKLLEVIINRLLEIIKLLTQ